MTHGRAVFAWTVIIHIKQNRSEDYNAKHFTALSWRALQANALQEKTESDAQQELKADDDEDDEEYDPENEHFDDDAEDRSEAYKVLASQVSVSTSNRSSAQEKVKYCHGSVIKMPCLK